MRFIVTIPSPPGNPHVACFQPVAELVAHGLRALGHEAEIERNAGPAPGWRQIVIGPLTDTALVPLAPDAILYQLEQVGSDWFTTEHVELLRHHVVWDGSRRNAEAIGREFGIRARYVPLGHVEQLVRIPRHEAPEDIDVLFYGSLNDRRRQVLGELGRRGVNVHALWAVYGRELDGYIARAKVVLNLHYYPRKTLQTMRLTYALSNGRCVVSEASDHPDEDAEFAAAVRFCPYEDVVPACLKLLEDDAARDRLGHTGQALMRAHPEAEILREALAAEPEPSIVGTKEEDPVDDRPLLCLCMILKNEAAHIEETLASVRGILDTWCILDTGSTDGTQELVRKALAGIPGELHEEPFIPFRHTGRIDFAATRNRCLDLAGDCAVWTLSLSGDENVHGAAALRRWCEEHRNDPHPFGGHFVRVRYHHGDSPTVRLGRTRDRWRYVFPIHEVLAGPTGSLADPRGDAPPDTFIDHVNRPRPPAELKAAMERDLEILTILIAENPRDERAAWYLASTHETLGHHDLALKLFARRAALGGWPEEVWEALYHVALCGAAVNYPWELVQQLYLDAFAYAPHRAEPLVRIAEHWNATENWPLCHLFAARAAALPLPLQDRRWIVRHDYEVRALDLVAGSAWHLGQLEEGRAAAAKVQAAEPTDIHAQNVERYDLRIKGEGAAQRAA